MTGIIFPEDADRIKHSQRLLGAFLYVAPFIPNCSGKTAPLTGMAHRKLDWSESSWVRNCQGSFKSFLDDIPVAVELDHPDYVLEWTLPCYPSDVGVRAVAIYKCME